MEVEINQVENGHFAIRGHFHTNGSHHRAHDEHFSTNGKNIDVHDTHPLAREGSDTIRIPIDMSRDRSEATMGSSLPSSEIMFDIIPEESENFDDDAEGLILHGMVVDASFKTDPETPTTSEQLLCPIEETIQTPPQPQSADTTEVEKFEVLGITDKQDLFHNAIPKMPLGLAIICFILNVFGPGLGTLVASFSVLFGAKTNLSVLRAFLVNLLSALLQILTALIIVGWVWSISWGMNFVNLALGHPEAPHSSNQRYLIYARRQSSLDQYHRTKRMKY